jgi:hypothetical protein
VAERPEVTVHPVPEGSIIVMRMTADPELMGTIAEALPDVIGHDRFVVLYLASGGDVAVWGPDDDLHAKLAELLGPAESDQPTPGLRPLPSDRCTCPGPCDQHGAKRRL